MKKKKIKYTQLIHENFISCAFIIFENKNINNIINYKYNKNKKEKNENKKLIDNENNNNNEYIVFTGSYDNKIKIWKEINTKNNDEKILEEIEYFNLKCYTKKFILLSDDYLGILQKNYKFYILNLKNLELTYHIKTFQNFYFFQKIDKSKEYVISNEKEIKIYFKNENNNNVNKFAEDLIVLE